MRGTPPHRLYASSLSRTPLRANGLHHTGRSATTTLQEVDHNSVAKSDVRIRVRFDNLYRVVLYNRNLADVEMATRAVKSAIPTLSPTEARRVVEGALRYGSAIALTCPRSDGLAYIDRLRRSSMFATIEEA